MTQSNKLNLMHVFTQNAKQSIHELAEIVSHLIDEGTKPELLEAIFRTTLTIKSLASTCNLNEIINFVETVIDIQFNKIRLQNSILSEDQKNEIRSNISKLKEMVDRIVDEESHETTQSDPSDFQQVPQEKRTAMLHAIGQLAIWNTHEIMNALTKIEGYSEIINETADSIDNSQLKIKDRIKMNSTKTIKAAEYLTALLNQIRSLRGNTVYEPMDFKLRKFLEYVHENFYTPKKDISLFITEIPDVTIHCDRIIFSQLLTNLWKLMQEWHRPHYDLNPKIASQIEKAIGVPNAKFKHNINLYIWEELDNSPAFQPEECTYTKHTPYPDLSDIFYFSTKAAERMDVEVLCSKTPSGQALFRISMPCAIQENKQPVLESKTKPLAKADAMKKSILIVDDEKDLRTILGIKINRMGYSVHTAATLKEAVDILNQSEIHLVISDLFLQGESGLDLLKSLSQAKPDVPFIFITGADEDDVPGAIFDMLRKYARAFLTKPVETNLLKETINKVLGGSK